MIGEHVGGPPMAERERVLSLVTRHGWNATAFQTLESEFSYLFFGEDACVAYVDTGGAWVAAGAPIAATEELSPVLRAFCSAASTARKRVCFFGAERRLLDADSHLLDALPIGEQPVWDPREWANVLAEKRSLREQLRRCRAKGVSVRELAGSELSSGPIRDEMERLTREWLASRGMAPMGFLVKVEPFTFPEHRRCFVAQQAGRLVAFAGVIPVPARGGFFLEDLVRAPDAPNGTAETLVDAVMRWAARSGSTWLTLGLAPLAGDMPAPLRIAKYGTRALYDFEGIRAYKAKFAPRDWTPLYLAYPKGQGTALSLLDALAAFTPDGFLRFGSSTLLRGPSAVLRKVGAMLEVRSETTR